MRRGQAGRKSRKSFQNRSQKTYRINLASGLRGGIRL